MMTGNEGYSYYAIPRAILPKMDTRSSVDCLAVGFDASAAHPKSCQAPDVLRCFMRWFLASSPFGCSCGDTTPAVGTTTIARGTSRKGRDRLGLALTPGTDFRRCGVGNCAPCLPLEDCTVQTGGARGDTAVEQGVLPYDRCCTAGAPTQPECLLKAA